MNNVYLTPVYLLLTAESNWSRIEILQQEIRSDSPVNFICKSHHSCQKIAIHGKPYIILYCI